MFYFCERIYKMPITHLKQITTQFTGESGVQPQRVSLLTDDDYTTITSPGYLNEVSLEGYTISPTSFIFVYYDNSSLAGIFSPSISNGVITLAPIPSLGNDVILPVTAGHFAIFENSSGVLQDTNKIPSNALRTNVVMASDTIVVGNLAEFEDASGTIFDSTIPANRVLQSSFNNPDISLDLVRFDATVSHTGLASGGEVILFPGTGTKQYKIIQMFINIIGTNFSGGGGDRELSITDDLTGFSVIPAASLQALTNSSWGSTALPFPLSSSINTNTAAGAPLLATYSSGTTDYTAGSVTISGILQRVS